MSQLTASDFQAYPTDVTQDDAITAGPNALYAVSLGSILPTQVNEGSSEVGKKTAGFDLLTDQAELTANLLTDIEPVVIGPDGKLYLLDGHHTFTALAESVWGASNPTVYVDVVANYSGMSETQFFQTLQSNNLLLPLNDGVPQTVNDATGAPIPTSLLDLTNDPYRGLEYSILKNKSSKLFANANNITGAAGASTAGLDKMTGFYSDFLEAAAYRGAHNGLGLAYLSPGDIALATQWNLNGNNVTSLPNIGAVHVYQLPGFILAQNVTIGTVISNATLQTGALDGNGTFTGITEINAGTASSPIIIGTPNVGFIMQLGNDKGFTVTLSNTANTYTGGTSLLAGTLIIASDGSLGAAPTETDDVFRSSLTFNSAGVPTNVKAAVQAQAENGIIFNGLTEGNPTLTLGTSAGSGTTPFTLSRVIAVGGEVATLNINDYTVTLGGELISLGVDGDGIGNATGFSDFTIDDLSTAGTGKLILSVASPNFYGNIIIGNKGTPTVEAMSDAALGSTTGPADMIGQVELNGGTLQVGANNITATERNMFLGGGSSIDVNGFTSSWGTLTDVQRTIDILNSNTSSKGKITFQNLTISATATLQLAGGAAGETVTFTNGIVRTGADTLVIQPSGSATLGSSEQVFSGTGAASLVNGIAPVWIVENNGASKSAGPYDFVTYGANGYVKATYTSTATLNASTANSVIALSGTATLTADAQVYALNTEGKSIALGGHTLTIGDGTDAAGLILASGTTISNGTLAFGTSEGVIWLSGTNPTISAQITGSDGLTFAGSGTVAISTAANVSGAITIDSGTVTLSGVDIFKSDSSGILIDDTKSKPSAGNLNITANNTLDQLNSVGNNSTITLSGGAALTLGDTINNFSSTINSTVTESGAVTAGALTFDGAGLFDLSGGKINLVTGSTIVLNNSAQLRIVASELSSSNFSFVLNGTSQLQFAQNGGGVFANAVSGTGELHLIGGTLQLTGINNTYSGGTVVETGSTLDLTTANVSSGNANITDAGGLVVFDQNVAGTYSGVISDGLEMGTGQKLLGSLDIDDSAASDASSDNVTLAAVQTYTGATYVEAGTLTLGVVNAIGFSSGVTLGRVGGAATGSTYTQTAHLVLAADNEITSLSDNAGNTTSVVLNGHVLTLAPAATSSSIYGGTISDGSGGAGSLVIDGQGTVTLSGANTYTGSTTITSGTLSLAALNAISDSSGLILGGVIDANQTAQLVLGANNLLASLSDNAGNTTSVLLDGHVLTLAPALTSTSIFGGTIMDGTGGAGSLVIDGQGTVALDGTNTFSGGTAIVGGTLELGDSKAAGSGIITFASDPTLKIDKGVDPTNTIVGFGAGDDIDLVGFDASTTTTDMNYRTDVLTVSDSEGDRVTLYFAGNFTGEVFSPSVSSDGVQLSVACYCRGTLIRTAGGEKPVEALEIGDAVLTAAGAVQPIRWIGKRSYGGRFLMGRADVLPICIKAGALADNVPAIDLWISPHHAMYLDGVLIEAKDLVNGVSIVQAQSVDKVEYFHIELDSHDVIIANGALSETFVDDDSRAIFHNAHEYDTLYSEADAEPAPAQYCAPRCHEGYQVEVARRRIAERAGIGASPATAADLRGFIDDADPTRIQGWAQSIDHPEAPVCLDIFAGGRLIGQVLANRYREDLERAGLGSGRHSFEVELPAGLVVAPETIEVRRSLDGAALQRTERSRSAA
jgi:autotransporter-associated beta strand protein